MLNKVLVSTMLFLISLPLWSDDATWSAIGRAKYVRVVYERFDGLGYCACTFNGQDVCQPSSIACFKAGTSVFVSVTDPPISGIKPGISPLPVEQGGGCYRSDGFNVEPTCEDLPAILGSCAKVQEIQFGSTPSGAGTRTTFLYRCVPEQAAKCVGLAGHLTPGTRVEQLTDAYGNGGGVPEHPAELQQRVAEEGCN